MKNLNVIVKRFDADEVSHFDKGVFETIKQMKIVAGRAIKEWMEMVRTRRPKINKDYCDGIGYGLSFHIVFLLAEKSLFLSLVIFFTP